MDITIRPLSPALREDYFDFFDNTAFADHAEWAGCYCTFFHMAPSEEDVTPLDNIGARRALAEKLIGEGVITGYLAYCGSRVAGWCNAGDKARYARLRADPDMQTDGETVKTKSVVCFLIAPDQRGKGIAAALLDKVCADAAAEGCTYVEGYPARNAKDSFGHYHGPASMYEKAGFETIRQLAHNSIMRKKL